MAGIKCRRKLHLKKDKQSGAKKIINMFFGKGVTYEIIQNLENYSLFCWNEILKLCDQKIKNLNQEELDEYKKNISEFLENFTKYLKDTKKKNIVIEKFKSYLRQIEEKKTAAAALLEQTKRREAERLKEEIAAWNRKAADARRLEKKKKLEEVANARRLEKKKKLEEVANGFDACNYKDDAARRQWVYYRPMPGWLWHIDPEGQKHYRNRATGVIQKIEPNTLK